MESYWNDRYGKPEYAYGTEPNVWFREALNTIGQPGRLLMAAEGEGRNAVYAAMLGWQVEAFDQSVEGQKKALSLAQTNGVTIDYQVGPAEALSFEPGSFAALGLIYAHFPAEHKAEINRKLATGVRSGGYVIFEAFSKNQLSYQAQHGSGGPKDIAMLFSMDEVANDFADFDPLYLDEVVVPLLEGKFHDGLGSVIRFLGRKR